MLDITPDALAPLVDPIPTGGAPAAWWITGHPTHLAEARAFVEAEAAWDAAVEALASEVGSDSTGVMVTVGRGREYLHGFRPVEGRDPAIGWRVDAKSNLIVPSKRTKADRDTGSEQRFQALSQVPVPGAYLTGIGFGFTAGNRYYPAHFQIRDSVIMAFVMRDPAECTRGAFQVDDTWTSVPMSTFHLLRERAAIDAA